MATAIESSRRLAAAVRDLTNRFREAGAAVSAGGARAGASGSLADAIRRGQAPEIVEALREALR